MIRLLVVGKIKESYYRDAIVEFQKRIKKYTSLEIVEVADSSFVEPKLNQLQEEKLLLKQIQPKDYVITLEIKGEMIDSIALSKKIEDLQIRFSTIVFVIGGSDGLGEQVRSRIKHTKSSKEKYHEKKRIYVN